MFNGSHDYLYLKDFTRSDETTDKDQPIFCSQISENWPLVEFLLQTNMGQPLTAANCSCR